MIQSAPRQIFVCKGNVRIKLTDQVRGTFDRPGDQLRKIHEEHGVGYKVFFGFSSPCKRPSDNPSPGMCGKDIPRGNVISGITIVGSPMSVPKKFIVSAKKPRYLNMTIVMNIGYNNRPTNISFLYTFVCSYLSISRRPDVYYYGGETLLLL